MSANPPLQPSPGSFFIIETNNPIIPLSDDPAEVLDALGIAEWSDVTGLFNIGPPKAVFTSISEADIKQLVDAAEKIDPNYDSIDFNRYARVEPDLTASVDAQLAQLRSALPGANVYYDPPGIPPTGMLAANPFYDDQGYLREAPAGIDALYAWEYTGGKGEGEKYIDLELGWTLDHEDLVFHGVQEPPLYGGIDNVWRPHGTRTLGVLSAINNEVGVVGIASAAKFDVVSYYNDTRVNAMLAAINDLKWGSVLLLEAQLQSLSSGSEIFNLVPVELQPLDFKMIELATVLGITVIEAAGNGGYELKDVTNQNGKYVLDGKAGDASSHADFRDSGAIIVGGARNQVPHVKTHDTNFGRRVDCYSWGDGVWTTTSNNSGTEKNGYTGSYSGTSSASAIVAGAAVSLQGIAYNILNYRLSAYQMRDVLGNADAGTPLEGNVIDVVGVQPDLKRILQDDLIGAAPDLYLRDNILDTGDPHSGNISVSPDIIVLSDPELDPQGEFGEGSGTENTIDLSQAVTAGTDHHVYVRLRNRGALPATNVQIKVYWADVATLVTPDLWHEIGNATLGSVPPADILTVLGPVAWPSGSIPPAGHYCFIAVASCDQDPFPDIPGDLEWEYFLRLVRDSNNVTWRNFNVVEYVPDTSSPLPDYAPIDFMAYGGQHQDQSMDLEIHARLPEKSEILIEMPRNFFEQLSYKYPVSTPLTDGARFIILNPHGAFRFRNVRFPRGKRWPCRLHVRIDEAYRDYRYQIFARQVFGETEVGRVTWMLGPAKLGLSKSS